MKNIVIFPNTKCDRGCSHCGSDSSKADITFDPLLIPILVKEVSSLKGEKIISISGGGEPLLYRYITDLATGLLVDERNFIYLISSSCKNEEDTGFENLKTISEIENNRLRYVQSFNPYSQSFEKRVRFSLPLIFERARIVNIKLSADYKTLPSTYNHLIDILEDIGFTLKLPKARYSFLPMSRKIDRMDEIEKISKTILVKEDDLGKKAVSVVTDFISITGRAENKLLKSDNASNIAPFADCCSSLLGKENIFINSSGDIFPCTCGFAYSKLEKIVMGKIGEISLDSIFIERKKILRKLKARFEASEKILNHKCEYCF